MFWPKRGQKSDGCAHVDDPISRPAGFLLGHVFAGNIPLWKFRPCAQRILETAPTGQGGSLHILARARCSQGCPPREVAGVPGSRPEPAGLSEPGVAQDNMDDKIRIGCDQGPVVDYSSAPTCGK